MFDNARKWEHTRRIVHALISVNSTKPIDAVEIMPLLTDPPKAEPKKITREDIEEMRRKANERAIQIMQK